MNKAKRTQKLWIIVFLLPTLVVFGLLFAVPLFTTILSSFTKWNGMEAMHFVGVSNYVKIFSSKDFYTALINTLIWALCALLIHVPFGIIVALVLYRKKPGWKFTRSVFLIPNMISKTALAMMFTFVFKPDIGVLNSLFKMVGLESFTRNWFMDSSTALFSITNIWLWYAGLITLIVFSELSALSPELAESASIDGASPLQIDLLIYLPQLKRIIGTSIIIAVTGVFKEFETIFLTTSGGPGNSTMNLSMLMYNRITNQNNYGQANAIGVVLLLLCIGVMAICNTTFAMDKED
ncbi:sugar ABC transporter permease [Lachnospiraceae bacterium ZAX-1]